MHKKQLEGRRTLQRIAALPYNNYFKQEAQRIRSKDLGLRQGERFTRSKWESLNVIQRRELKKDIHELIERFQLPQRVLKNVLWYVCTGYEHYISISLSPRVALDWEMSLDMPELKVTISHLSPWTSKKQWYDIWRNYIEEQMHKGRQFYEKIYGLPSPGRKRTTAASYSDRMKEYSTWYELSKKLTIKEVLDKYFEGLPAGKRPDESTVFKGIKEFEDIVTPISKRALKKRPLPLDSVDISQLVETELRIPLSGKASGF